MLKNIALFLLLLLLFAGCSTKEVQPTPVQSENTQESPAWVKKALYKEYDKWCDTPYKLGGEGDSGIDCSALVQTVYKDAFGIKLPRATDEQIKVGYKIPVHESKEGDLIFFKINKKVRHAGIVIDKGRFLHTSSTDGVTISEFSNPYWKTKYWQTRRVLP